MKHLIFAFALIFAAAIRPAFAQEAFFVQVEAQPSLLEAEERVRDYAAGLPDVAGFALPGGWYGIALGPYSRSDAEARLRQLRAAGQVPRDAYVAAGSQYRQQFWPIGANISRVLNLPAPAPTPETTEEAVAQDPVIEEPQVQAPDETPREARASEAALSRDERKDLQVALKWAGFYTAAIDGAFGRGTRRSMAAWQEANNIAPTGVLTTGQRALLFKQYNAVLEGLDLELVADTTAVIEMLIPKGVVAFDAYQSPFARFAPSGEVQAQVLLISQPGSQRTLFGLYDVMQTLEIVPSDGPRDRRRDGFTITGENARLVSHTEATLTDGAIKGFTLIWPAGDEERRSRVLDKMQKSFRVIDGVMPLEIGADETQSIDLVSGLAVRKPLQTRSGFFVDGAGHVMTSSDAVEGCGSITLDGQYAAKVETIDAGRGLALLAPEDTLAPAAIAALAPVTPRLQSEVAVSGFSFGGVLGAPTMTFGTLADARGLNGEDWLNRLALAPLDGDAGGPVLDSKGAVVGLLQPRVSNGRELPADVAFATDAEALREALTTAGITPQAAPEGAAMAAEDLTVKAAGFTVLVSCWE